MNSLNDLCRDEAGVGEQKLQRSFYILALLGRDEAIDVIRAGPVVYTGRCDADDRGDSLGVICEHSESDRRPERMADEMGLRNPRITGWSGRWTFSEWRGRAARGSSLMRSSTRVHRYLPLLTTRGGLRELVKILKRLCRINGARTARHLDGDGKDFDKFLSTRTMFLGGRGMIDNAIVAAFGDRDRHCSQFFDFGG